MTVTALNIMVLIFCQIEFNKQWAPNTEWIQDRICIIFVYIVSMHK